MRNFIRKIKHLEKNQMKILGTTRTKKLEYENVNASKQRWRISSEGSSADLKQWWKELMNLKIYQQKLPKLKQKIQKNAKNRTFISCRTIWNI